MLKSGVEPRGDMNGVGHSKLMLQLGDDAFSCSFPRSFVLNRNPSSCLRGLVSLRWVVQSDCWTKSCLDDKTLLQSLSSGRPGARSSKRSALQKDVAEAIAMRSWRGNRSKDECREQSADAEGWESLVELENQHLTTQCQVTVETMN